jgi:hypothetical protein
MPNSFTEGQHALAFLISESSGNRSREQGTVLAGSGSARALTAGMVVGKRLIGAAGAATAFAGNTGNGVMGAITVTGPAKRGGYKLIVITVVANAGNFLLFDPDGILVGKGAVAAAFALGGVAFTLADGATDFAVGDGFDIAVSGGTDKYLQTDFAGTLGEQNAAGILMQDVSAADAVDNANGAFLIRHAEVASAELVWIGGASAAQKAAALLQLNRLGIRER